MHSRPMDLRAGAPKAARRHYVQIARGPGLVGNCDEDGLRRETEDLISQRLFSIVLAVHAAQANLDEDAKRIAEILELIRTQTVASLEDLVRLGALR